MNNCLTIKVDEDERLYEAICATGIMIIISSALPQTNFQCVCTFLNLKKQCLKKHNSEMGILQNFGCGNNNGTDVLAG